MKQLPLLTHDIGPAVMVGGFVLSGNSRDHLFGSIQALYRLQMADKSGAFNLNLHIPWSLYTVKIIHILILKQFA
jgi:hypothetical protein